MPAQCDPHEVATLVLRYYQMIDYLGRKQLPVYWERPVVPAANEESGPAGFNEIPGRKPIGYLPAYSPVRMFSRGDVRDALEVLERVNPRAHHVLLAELGPGHFGENLDAEWWAAKDLHDRSAQLRDQIQHYRTAVRAKRRLLELSPPGSVEDLEQNLQHLVDHVAYLQSELELIEERATPQVVAIFNQVLEAAGELARLLSVPSLLLNQSATA